MRFDYFQPAPDLRDLVGSYYIMDMPDGGADVLRVEIPHLRILVRGTSELMDGDRRVVLKSPTLLASGPVTQASYVSVSPDTLIFGIALTPLGWQTLLGIPMNRLANRKVDLADFLSVDAPAMQDRLMSARTDADLVNAIDDFLRGLPRMANRVNQAFVDAASAWLLDRTSPGVDVLREGMELSSRQLDRLCNTYFGASPKRLHRKYRALHISNQLAWTGETDWRKVVGDQFHDQPHFIKDFKSLIGCTPGEFIKGPNMMIRFTLMQRLAIPHMSQFSLIG